MSHREFNIWLSTFIPSIASYDYYVDFEKVYRNVNNVVIELNILNSLIGSKNVEYDFVQLVKLYPETLRCIPILLAVRHGQIAIQETDENMVFNFLSPNVSTEDYARFMRLSGLFDLLENRLVGNLLDYVTGVETGLDSNGRKNRGGHLMENLIRPYFDELGLTYQSEMYAHEIEKKWGVDLSRITNNGKAKKRFDFAVKTASMVYGIEANFYAGGGSKLNETARSYKSIAMNCQDIKGFTFVWFTDGFGWHSAKNNLEETFDIMEHVYNINDIKAGIMKLIFK